MHAKLRTILLVFYLCLCVCRFLQEMVGVATKDLAHAKVEGLTKGLCAPGQPLTQSTIHFCFALTLKKIVLHTRVHLIIFFAETQDTTEWPHRG